jgi:hypothetical protein
MHHRHVPFAANSRFVSAAALILLLVSPVLVYGFSGGPPNEVTGAPGEGTCVDCHSDFALNSGPGSLVIEGPLAFEPSATYTITITLTQNGQSRWGFEFSPLDVGTCTVTDPTTTQLEIEGGKTYVKHTSAGTYNGTPGPTSWAFDWTAPSDAPEEVTFYAAGNAANGDGSTTGDYIYTATFTMSVVPVELTYFRADVHSGHVALQWRTLSESNNAGFRLYRSDEDRYRLISPELIPGAGTTTIPHDYSFVDNAVTAGKTYQYRLSDISLDGVEAFHHPIEVTLPVQSESGLDLRISPNPVRFSTDILFTISRPMPTSITLHDLTGRVRATLISSAVSQGRNTIRWDLGDPYQRDIPFGLYFCTVRAGDEIATKPVLVMP